MRDRHDSTRPSAGNAFDRAFLDLLDPEDDPVTATEAVAEGPWTVVRVTAPTIPFAEPNGPEPWAVVREGDRAEDEPPAATFVHLHPARLAAAAVPIAARDAAYRLGREQDPRGFALRQDGRVVGHLPWHHQELVAALNHLDALARSPRALAAVLEAAGASALARVGALLARRWRRRGRRWSAGGLSGDQVLRCAILKQMNGFSLRELAFHLADSRTYGTFCRLGWAERAPSKSALAAGIKALRPETLEQVHRLLLTTATAGQVESGRKVRVDSTVVEAAIHWPSDSELLWDGVRVLTRLMESGRRLLEERCPSFARRLRRAKRRRLAALNAKSKRDRRRAYRDLLRVTEEVVDWAVQVHDALSREPTAEAAVFAAKLAHFLPLVRQVVDQTRRRVLEGQSVPVGEKLVSLFEEHTDILRKDGRDTYYGHKVFLTSGASALVLDCRILRGNPADSSQAVAMIERQIELYGRPPRQVAFDGGFASNDNLAELKGHGVADVARDYRCEAVQGRRPRVTAGLRRVLPKNPSPPLGGDRFPEFPGGLERRQPNGVPSRSSTRSQAWLA